MNSEFEMMEEEIEEVSINYKEFLSMDNKDFSNNIIYVVLEKDNDSYEYARFYKDDEGVHVYVDLSENKKYNPDPYIASESKLAILNKLLRKEDNFELIDHNIEDPNHLTLVGILSYKSTPQEAVGACKAKMELIIKKLMEVSDRIRSEIKKEIDLL